MLDIIIAFPRIDDARNLKKVLGRAGYEVRSTCDQGSQVASIANESDGGIVICGYQLSDMVCQELYNYLPKGFSMIVVASPAKLEYCTLEELKCVEMPLRVSDLLNVINEISLDYNRLRRRDKAKKRFRSRADQEQIDKAKAWLMQEKQMSENEAHRYLQKLSMDGGHSLVETAGMLLDIHGKE